MNAQYVLWAPSRAFRVVAAQMLLVQHARGVRPDPLLQSPARLSMTRAARVALPAAPGHGPSDLVANTPMPLAPIAQSVDLMSTWLRHARLFQMRFACHAISVALVNLLNPSAAAPVTRNVVRAQLALLASSQQPHATHTPTRIAQPVLQAVTRATLPTPVWSVTAARSF